MMLNNEAIADNFALLAKLMEIHGENPFKIKSYVNIARTIEKSPRPWSEMTEAEIFATKGVGEAIGQKILTQLKTGELPILQEYLSRTPEGILEMLHIKGLGPKKISVIWKDLQIESIGELLYACNENRLLNYKGFGAKTQETIRQAIEFYLKAKGLFLFAEIEPTAIALNKQLAQNAPLLFLEVGAYRAHQIIIDKLSWVTDATLAELNIIAQKNNWALQQHIPDLLQYTTAENVTLEFHLAEKENIYTRQFILTGSEAFHQKWAADFGDPELLESVRSEKAIFSQKNCAFIPPFLREAASIIDLAKEDKLPQVIQPGDVKGIIHCHSNWSDGAFSLEEMAKAAKAQGFEYLVISDHSQTAVYAHGLSPEQVQQQHVEIDALNQQLAPFKIFKSIESDILNDGRLDYAPEILDSFDLVIASIHSNLRMTEEKAMSRLLAAISNPYTSILGHMTGRLLLSRAGYPVNHSAIIDACKIHDVVIELNAHPRRLDIDWHFIPEALGKNVRISIDPDSHYIEGFQDIRFGVLAAQKAGVTALQNLSSLSLPEMEQFIAVQKQKRKNG